MKEANNLVEKLQDDKEYTYVFQIKEDMDGTNIKPNRTSLFRRTIWQIFPSICGSLMCVPFGIMLGWPSPTYPNLLENSSIIPIDPNQSAMIAGFLMVGNSVATPFSSTRRFDAKYGILAGAVLMTLGWLAMWLAKDMSWLLLSRLFVGLGQGFGFGQLKIYISEICEENVGRVFTKYLNLFVFFGVIVAFAIGPYVEFKRFGIVGLIISIFVLFLAIFLPSTPRALVKIGKIPDAQRLIQFLNPDLNVDDEITRIRTNIDKVEDEIAFLCLFKDRVLLKNFVIFACLVLFQQYSGVAATVVYCQILFRDSPYSELCALIYSVVYFLSNALYYSINVENKKFALLLSSIGTSLVLLIQILVLALKITEFWNYTWLILMLCYVIVHTLGLGNIPVTYIPYFFPKKAHKVIAHFFIIFHSVLALTITKTFQVMYFTMDSYSPFCLFLGISSLSIVFTIIFVPKQTKSSDPC